MEIQNSDSINEILPRYCEGDVSDEERKRVDEWIAQSDENYRIVRQIYILYLATDTMNIQTKVDTEKALSQVGRRMSVSHKTTWLQWVQRVAAILFIPLLITLFTQNFYQKSQIAQMIEVRTNPGMTTTVNLPDGTIVHLNSESTLSYPSYFDGGIRNVHLTGEAFFSVTKDKTKRFVVSTPHNTSVEVLGTCFNVEAFDKDMLVSTTIVEGKVNFTYTKNEQLKAVPLKPGQKLVYDPKLSQVQIYATSGETETAWKDGKIVFLNTPLPQALHMLEKRYNVEFVIVNDQLREEFFTGYFTHQRLDRILEIFKISSNIKWRYINTENAENEKTKIEIY